MCNFPGFPHISNKIFSDASSRILIQELTFIIFIQIMNLATNNNLNANKFNLTQETTNIKANVFAPGLGKSHVHIYLLFTNKLPESNSPLISFV